MSTYEVAMPEFIGFGLNPGVFGTSRTLFYALDKKGNIWEQERRPNEAAHWVRLTTSEAKFFVVGEKPAEEQAMQGGAPGNKTPKVKAPAKKKKV